MGIVLAYDSTSRSHPLCSLYSGCTGVRLPLGNGHERRFTVLESWRAHKTLACVRVPLSGYIVYTIIELKKLQCSRLAI